MFHLRTYYNYARFYQYRTLCRKTIPCRNDFLFRGEKYQVALCGKPRPARGECKTDVYIKGIAPNGEAKEIKISVKQKMQTF